MSWKSIVGVWLLILPFMIANGIFRETALVPRLGRTGSDVVSAVLGIAIILAITRPFIRRLQLPSMADLIRISLAWIVLTVLFELIFGHYVDGKSWSELAGNYAIWRGKLWPLVLLSLAAAPFIWTRSPSASRPVRG